MSGSDLEMELASVKSGFSYKSRSSTNSRSSSASVYVSDCFRFRDAMTHIQKTELLIRSTLLKFVESHFFPGLVWKVVALSKLARPDKAETCPDTGNYKYAKPEASAEESCL
ncbi:hypothetical protein TNCV_2429011 [Trichonephila clavipes]|nr:hypothetical protein TNCV_2429011 [Trichonephila clavipes]